MTTVQSLWQRNNSLQSTVTARKMLPGMWAMTDKRDALGTRATLEVGWSRGRVRKVRDRGGHCYVAAPLSDCMHTASSDKQRKLTGTVWQVECCRSRNTATCE